LEAVNQGELRAELGSRRCLLSGDGNRNYW
jgi:hypothetical protein